MESWGGKEPPKNPLRYEEKEVRRRGKSWMNKDRVKNIKRQKEADMRQKEAEQTPANSKRESS